MGKHYRERGKAVKEGKIPPNAKAKELKQKEAKENLFQRLQGAQIVASKWGCPTCRKGPVTLQSVKTERPMEVPPEPTFNCKACGRRGKLQDLIAYGAQRASEEAGEFIEAVNKRAEMLKPNEELPHTEMLTEKPPTETPNP